MKTPPRAAASGIATQKADRNRFAAARGGSLQSCGAGTHQEAALRLSTIASLFVFCAATSGAWAQTVFKSTMPDGRVVYGEKPAPGAKRVDKIEPPPAKTGMTAITPEEKTRAQQQPQGAAASQAQALDDARKQLEQAEAARESGKEPLPGERLGLKGGGSRLTEAYDERQKALELAVAAARKRLDQLQSGR
jgi:hypothetical protein